MEPARLADALTAAATRRFGAGARIDRLEAVSAGASAQTWRFDMVLNDRTQPLILQLATGEHRFSGALRKAQQALVQQVAWRHGVPTPHIVWILEPGDGLGDGYVAERIDGETLGKRIVSAPELEDARGVMAVQCGGILARVHGIELGQISGLEAHSAEALLARLAAQHNSYGQRLPVFALAFRWLNDHLPAPRAGVLVHGDFRTGNFIVDSRGIAAVLDWEMAHVGDPMEDVGWLCMNAWRFGQLDKPVGGFGTRESFYEAYEQACGCPVDERAVHFWEVFGTVKWGVVCQYFMFQHLCGDVRSLERAAIGRRVSETELDLLELLEMGVPS
jgi:aminoglycoside phosphotransferase (APT) family kinase protein